MYEVICTTYSPDIQISVRENTNTVNETVWLCRTYFALIREIPPKTLKNYIRKALYCEFIMIQCKNMTISIHLIQNEYDSLS